MTCKNTWMVWGIGWLLLGSCTQNHNGKDAGASGAQPVKLAVAVEQVGVADVLASVLEKEMQKQLGVSVSFQIKDLHSADESEHSAHESEASEFDFALVPGRKLAKHNSVYRVLDLPFYYSSSDSFSETLGKLHKIDQGFLDSNRKMQILGIWNAGPRVWLSRHPIRRPLDFEGKVVATQRNRVLVDQYQIMGARAITTDHGQLTRTGGQDFDVIAATLSCFQKEPLIGKFPYLIHSDFSFDSHALLGNRQKLQKLLGEKLNLEPFIASLQTALLISQKAVQTYLKKEEAEMLQIFKKHGGKELQISQKAKKLFQWQTAPIVNEVLLAQKNSISDSEGFLGSENHWVLGLDTDLLLGSRQAGQSINAGIEKAVQEINAAGGLLGRKIKVVALNHSGNPTKGKSNLKKLSEIKNLLGVFGGVHSPVILSQMDLIHDKDLIFLVPWAAATPIVENGRNPSNVFRVSLRDSFAAPFLLERAISRSKKIGLILEETVWGRSNHKGLQTAFSGRGMQPEFVYWFKWGEKSFPGLKEMIEGKQVDSVILVSNVPEGVELVKIFSRMKSPPKIFSHWGIAAGSFYQATREILKEKVKLSFIQTSAIELATERQRQFNRDLADFFQLQQGEFPKASIGAFHAYDLTHLFAKAVKAAGSQDSTKIRTALKGLKAHEGLMKIYVDPFGGDHDALTEDDVRLAKWNEQGLIQLEPTGKAH